MAQTPNGKPRAISGQARDVYAERLRREAELREWTKETAEKLTPDWDRHPDIAESLIPVWGSAREAIADYREGDIPGAALNGVLALTDLGGGWSAKALGKTMLKAASKSGSRVGLKRPAKDPYAWNHARKRMAENGYLEKGQDAHHWLIPQNGWAKKIPTAVKNQPWNIKPMPNSEVGKAMHGRITNAYTMPGRPKEEQMKRYNALQRYIVGTPTWAKAVQAGIIGHPAGAAKAEWDKSR
jgi:hypothetical protein